MVEEEKPNRKKLRAMRETGRVGNAKPMMQGKSIKPRQRGKVHYRA
jgi:hypothetical protein